MIGNAQRQQEQHEKVETLADVVINAVEVLEAQALNNIANNEFDHALPIIQLLTEINGMLEGGGGV